MKKQFIINMFYYSALIILIGGSFLSGLRDDRRTKARQQADHHTIDSLKSVTTDLKAQLEWYEGKWEGGE